jgi:hypothetical protein
MSEVPLYRQRPSVRAHERCCFREFNQDSDCRNLLADKCCVRPSLKSIVNVVRFGLQGALAFPPQPIIGSTE